MLQHEPLLQRILSLSFFFSISLLHFTQRTKSCSSILQSRQENRFFSKKRQWRGGNICCYMNCLFKNVSWDSKLLQMCTQGRHTLIRQTVDEGRSSVADAFSLQITFSSSSAPCFYSSPFLLLPPSFPPCFWLCSSQLYLSPSKMNLFSSKLSYIGPSSWMVN